MPHVKTSVGFTSRSAPVPTKLAQHPRATSGFSRSTLRARTPLYDGTAVECGWPVHLALALLQQAEAQSRHKWQLVLIIKGCHFAVGLRLRLRGIGSFAILQLFVLVGVLAPHIPVMVPVCQITVHCAEEPVQIFRAKIAERPGKVG